jgi:hypothetical protein
MNVIGAGYGPRMDRTGDLPKTKRKEIREVVRCIECGGPVRLDEQEAVRMCAKCQQEPALPHVG